MSALVFEYLVDLFQVDVNLKNGIRIRIRLRFFTPNEFGFCQNLYSDSKIRIRIPLQAFVADMKVLVASLLCPGYHWATWKNKLRGCPNSPDSAKFEFAYPRSASGKFELYVDFSNANSDVQIQINSDPNSDLSGFTYHIFSFKWTWPHIHKHNWIALLIFLIN